MSGTSTSEDLRRYLEDLARVVAVKFRVKVWFAEILGRRWSYIAGEREDTFLPPVKVQLTEKMGVVLIGVHSHGQVEEVKNFILSQLRTAGFKDAS